MADIIKTLGIDNEENVVEQKGINEVVEQDVQDVVPVLETEELVDIPEQGPIVIEEEKFEEDHTEVIPQGGPIDPNYVENDFDKFARLNKERDINTIANDSTGMDYEDVNRTGALLNNHPELQTSYYEAFEPWDVKDPDYINAFDNADEETKQLMNDSPNHIVAVNVYNRRKVYDDALTRISADGNVDNILTSLYYGITSYDSLVPGFTILKGGKMAYNATKLAKTVNYSKGAGNLAFNASLATAYSEATFGATGLETNLLTALAINNGMAFTLDTAVKAIAGRYGSRIAKSLTKPSGKTDDIGTLIDDTGLIKGIDEDGVPRYTTPEKEGWIQSKNSKGEDIYVNPNLADEIVVREGVDLEVKANGKVDVEVKIKKGSKEFEELGSLFHAAEPEGFRLNKSDSKINPKVNKQDGKWNDDISKVIYIAGGNGKSANKFKKILKEEYKVPKKEIARISKEIKEKIRNGEEININEIAPNLKDLSVKKDFHTKTIEVDPEQIKDNIVLCTRC